MSLMFPVILSRTIIMLALSAIVMQETPITPEIIQLLTIAFTCTSVIISAYPCDSNKDIIESACKSPKNKIYTKRTIIGAKTEKNTVILSFIYNLMFLLTKTPSDNQLLHLFVDFSMFKILPRDT